MELMTAAAKLNIMARYTENQQEREALALGVEALRRQAGYPPNLPGYCTLEKVDNNNVALFYYFAKFHGQKYNNIFCYLSRWNLDRLKAATYKGEPIVTYSDRNCYEESTPLVCGVPVILGAEDALKNNIWLVSKIE
jgi:hypothetical protein